MLINDLEYFEKSSNYSSNVNGMDQTGENHYSFNSWGFRGNDYQQYIGQPVIICLGDSFTVNIGGPIEHSWPSILAKHFPIPTLNLGMDGAGNDAIKLLYYRACDLFDVQFTFVMYSFMHRRLIDNKFTYNVYEDEENYAYFESQRFNAIECILPNWVWAPNTELKYLRNTDLFMLEAKEWQLFADDININRACVVEKSYNNLRGPDWPTYKQFVTGAEIHPDMLTEKFGDFIQPSLQYKNRDGYHLSFLGNQIYANYLYNQWSKRES